MFNTKPSDKALEEACQYVARMFADKQEYIQNLTVEKAASFIGKNPEFLYELGYEEPVLAAAFGEKYKLRQWFRDVAKADKLETLTPDGYLATNDLSLVREIARKGEAALFHKGKAFPYCVEGEGRKAKIVKYSRALSKRTGAVNGKAFLTRAAKDTSVNTAEVDAVIAKGTPAPQEQGQSVEEELARLKAENAKLKAKNGTPVLPKAPVVETPAPTTPTTVTVQ